MPKAFGCFVLFSFGGSLDIESSMNRRQKEKQGWWT